MELDGDARASRSGGVESVRGIGEDGTCMRDHSRGGQGSRLNGTAGDKPKCLVEAGGITLIERQIRALERPASTTSLSSSAARPTGSARLWARVTYVENSRFAETNSLYSLWMARALLYEGFVVLNCDVLFHPGPARRPVGVPPCRRAAHRVPQPDQTPFGDEEMKVKVRRGRVVEMSKTMDPAEADGENVGIVKFGADGAAGW